MQAMPWRGCDLPSSRPLATNQRGRCLIAPDVDFEEEKLNIQNMQNIQNPDNFTYNRTGYLGGMRVYVC